MSLIPPFIYQKIIPQSNLIKIFSNAGWLLLDKVIRMGGGLLVGVWVARYLGPENFGLFSFASAFVGMFGAISGLGLQGIVVRDIVRDQSCAAETLGSTAALQLAGGILAYGCSLVAIFWLRPDDSLVRVLVAILGSVLLFRASEISLYWFESQVMSKFVVLAQNLSFIIFAVVKVCLILQHATLIAFAWISLAEALLVSFFLLALLNWRTSMLRIIYVSKVRVKSLLADSWPLFLSGIAIMTYMKIDQIMLGEMLGDRAVGLFSAATRISEIFYILPMIIVASVFPSILKVRARSKFLYSDYMQRLYSLMVVLSIFIAIPMTFLSSKIIAVLYGDQYLASGSVLAIHIWATLFVFLGVASSQWFIAENRQILSFQRTVIGAFINIILNLFLIPKYGIVGAAWATVFAQMYVGLFADLLQKETYPMFLMKLKSFNPLLFITKLSP